MLYAPLYLMLGIGTTKADEYLCMLNKNMNKKHSTSFYTVDMKMAELVRSDYKLLLLFTRFGMELGVGEDTIATQCERQGISPTLFVMVCNIYSFADYRPTRQDVEGLDVELLLSYLSRSHTYYIEARLQPIEQQLRNISDHCAASHKAVLLRFFAEYRQEVMNHFDYEENIVFPYIRKLVACHEMQQGYDIETFERNHSNIDDKLSDLKNILIKYLPGIGMAAEQTELLFQIFSLEDDLSHHTFIENVVLIPLVRHMELLSYDK